MMMWQDVEGFPSTRSLLTVRRIDIMAWTKPTIAEVPASMEINMYACAKQK